MFRSACLALTLLFAAPAFAAEPSTDIAAGVNRLAEAAIAAGESAGLQVAVIKDGKVVVERGYGAASLELGVPVSRESVFRVGSVTKQFTSAALLLLAEEGKLSVDDPLSKFFPEFPRAGDVTLRQMLTHTSGIASYTEWKTYGSDSRIDKSVKEIVAAIAAQPKPYDFEPGTAWNYSNSAYFILGAVVEKVEGKPLGEVFKKRFFTPLGMTRTAMDDAYEIVPGRAAGYDSPADKPRQFTNTTYTSMTWPGGAGAMRSTAGDIARWGEALTQGKVLKPASWAMMTAPGKLKSGALSSTAENAKGMKTAGAEYGFGLMTGVLEGHRKVGHGGGINGFASAFDVFPADRVTVVVLSNTIGGPAGAGTVKVTPKIQHLVLGLAPPTETPALKK